jgi:hypothetical protein
MELSADLKARILSATRSQPSPTRGQVRLKEALWVAAGAGLAVAIFAAAGGVRVLPRPTSLIIVTGLGTAAIAALASWIIGTRGRSMLGRPRALVALTALVAPATLFAWKVGTSNLYPGMTDPWPTRPGLRCFLLSGAIGVLPLLAVLIARRRTVPVQPAMAGAGLGISAGLQAAVLVDLWCPVAYVPHLLVGHLFPIAALAGVGAWMGVRLLTIRASTSAVRHRGVGVGGM